MIRNYFIKLITLIILNTYIELIKFTCFLAFVTLYKYMIFKYSILYDTIRQSLTIANKINLCSSTMSILML